MASSSINSLLWLIFLFSAIIDKFQSEEFIFNGFLASETKLLLDRASVFKPSGALRLTNRSQNAIGHAFYYKPIQILNKTSSDPVSFNTSFVFSIVPPASGEGGYGFAFALAPSYQIPGAAAEHYLGLFNDSNDGNGSNHIFAVEFDTVKGFKKEEGDSDGNHVGININSMDSNTTRAAAYTTANDGFNEDALDLHSGEPIQAWIEYDGVNKIVNVTICPMKQPKPIRPLITFSGLDLSVIVKETTYIGFSASTGIHASSHYILGWSFSTTGVAPALNLDQLPIPPVEKDSSSLPSTVVALIIALCVMAVLLLGMLCLSLYKRMETYETLEDWELECPHRFRYRDLYTATKGFKESEIIGVGGFGTVYKAVIPGTRNEVAVKRITRNSIQGMKEFAAEIESLGRLRHKHLVNLQGWCKKKNDLLLVYDYIPNGSLDSLLFHPEENNFVLTWDLRFRIVKGIAAGLLYLHEEWDQVVIHRDVKSSNVLIDAEMNGRLGDFGLARLYDHGVNSHTTNVVGTIGYIAPELARTGKASTRSDVFAYGVLLLEVATGRRPLESTQFILVDWVLECQQAGKILDAVDPKLNSDYVAEEVELVLELGLVCSHQKSDYRPSMRQVTRYLNGDDKLPVMEDWGSYDSHQLSQISSRLLQLSSCEMTSTSYHSSSIPNMSF